MVDLQPKIETLIKLCSGQHFVVGSAQFTAAAQVLKSLQTHQIGVDERAKLLSVLCDCFDLTSEQLLSRVYGLPSGDLSHSFSRYQLSNYNPKEADEALDLLIPQSGYFRHYVDYTRNSESPLSYHFFSALVGVASTINRRVFLRWGLFNYYPATGVILIGPSGLRKTSASDVVVGVLQDLQLVDVYAEKITPEALIEALKGENATGLIYAPEMAVFINRKKYNEGLIELITRWMDCPDIWKSNTIMRSKAVLHNLGISSLLCSTPDWLIDNLPEGTFGGGFVARFLLNVQEASPRVVTRPEPLDPSERERIKLELAYLHTFKGEMALSPEAWRVHEIWYKGHKNTSIFPEHELLGSYFQRKQGHVLRMAMCLHLATHYDSDSPYEICVDCHNRAVDILTWNEQFLPNLFQQMFKTSVGVDQGEVLAAIKASGGAISHSALLRRLQHKFDSVRIKGICSSLREAGQIREENGLFGHMYVLEVKR